MLLMDVSRLVAWLIVVDLLSVVARRQRTTEAGGSKNQIPTVYHY
ncbi:MAG: hypothetical protein V2I32_01465 [Desulforhopalus sp.]|jgi:hypothetical protein|nr:hypothetical protein [Desulforhopalus sp.]